MALSAKCLGLKGLVVLFDELEALYAARGQTLDRGINFLNALIATARGDEDLTAVR